jgi:glycosyltransferase involved in cell wall biosynthesis
MPPLVSLIMTVYNREAYLSSALTSVLQQTYKHWELILWDDGSTDRSAEIAADFASKDARIKLTTATHVGRAQSLQAAHALAQGDYLGWVDSDDLLAPSCLTATANVLDTRPEIGLVYTNHWVIDAQGIIQGLGKRCAIPYSSQRMLVDFMTFHFRLFRRQVFSQAGGIDLNFPAAIDYDLCLRMCEQTEVFHLTQPLYSYRVHPTSISGKQRLKQTYYASEAIQGALERRGLTETYELNVNVESRFLLQPKVK